jgi:hypothetical protein
MNDLPTPREHFAEAERLCRDDFGRVEEAVSDETGICLDCGSVSEDMCEPDARRYRCTACGAMAVYGAEEIILMGV